MRLFTPEQEAFVRAHVHGRPHADLTTLVNETFGLNLRVSQIKSFIRNHKLNTGLDGRFKPGHKPFNKGKKKWWVGGEDTQFPEGHRPHNYRPVGTERVNGDDYVDIKIADPNKWRSKHLLVWEQHHGRPLPKGCAVIFGDGNRRNFDPDNLILVSRGQLAVLNRRRLIQNDADLTRSAILVADLISKTHQRERKTKEGLHERST
jgi:hypothetical protein